MNEENDELRPEYHFDYSKAKPNRFASEQRDLLGKFFDLVWQDLQIEYRKPAVFFLREYFEIWVSALVYSPHLIWYEWPMRVSLSCRTSPIRRVPYGLFDDDGHLVACGRTNKRGRFLIRKAFSGKMRVRFVGHQKTAEEQQVLEELNRQG